MNNLFRFNEKKGYQKVIYSENSNMIHLQLDRIFLEAGECLEYMVEKEEKAIVLQNGDFKAMVECKDGNILEGITGRRVNVFDQRPTLIYLPPNSKIKMETTKGMEALVYSSQCDEECGSARIIKPEEVSEVYSGTMNWRRRVRVIIGPDKSIAKKLIVGESVSIPGGWIGFPPHKHDEDNNNEYPLEEIFSFKLDGPHGAMALYHTYNKNGYDEHYLIDSNDYAVAIPNGFHTSQAVPGCRYYLLWGLAGDKKVYKLTFDPDFAWLQDAEFLFEESIGRHLINVIEGDVK